MYSRKLKLSFIHIPKTAGSSLGDYFRSKNLCTVNIGHTAISEIKNMVAKEDFNDTPIDLRSVWGKSVCNEIMDSYKFTIVRNPYDRIRSYYSYVMKHEAKKLGLPSDLSFRDFVLQKPGPPRFSLARAWWPQVNYITIDGSIAIDEIIKFENINPKLFDLLKKQGLDPAGFPHALNTRSSRVSFSEDIKEKIFESYKKDFEIFGYDH